jgi:hypothetical protein
MRSFSPFFFFPFYFNQEINRKNKEILQKRNQKIEKNLNKEKVKVK